MADLIGAVREHALANYEQGGWDYVVECWSDADIAKEITGCTSAKVAIQKVGACVGVLDDYRSDIQAEIF